MASGSETWSHSSWSCKRPTQAGQAAQWPCVRRPHETASTNFPSRRKSPPSGLQPGCSSIHQRCRGAAENVPRQHQDAHSQTSSPTEVSSGLSQDHLARTTSVLKTHDHMWGTCSGPREALSNSQPISSMIASLHIDLALIPLRYPDGACTHRRGRAGIARTELLQDCHKIRGKGSVRLGKGAVQESEA